LDQKPETTMSQGKRDDGTTRTTPVTLALRLDAAPANDVTPAPANDVACATTADVGSARAAAALRAGPLGLPRVYWVLWSGMLLNRLGGTVFMLLGIYLTRDRGLRPELVGLVISLNAAGGLFAGPVGGALADRFGRRATLVGGTALSGALMLALGLARSTAAIVAIAPCLGFWSGICPPPLQAAVADVVAPADRARAYGLLYWAINLGFAGASAFGGVLAERHFLALFVIDAATTLAYGAIVLAGVPETKPAAPPAGATAAPSTARRRAGPFRDRRFMSFVAIQVLLLLAFAQVILALPLDMRRHGLGTAQIGWLLGMNGVAIVILQPIALRTIRGVAPVHWLAAGALLTGLGLGATALAGGAIVYLLSALLWTAGEIGFSTASPTLVAEFAPVHQRGAYQGTYQLAWGLSSTFAPVIGSVVLARLGSTALWLGCLGLSGAAAALHLRVTGRNVRAGGAS
jgi:MFS family permease